jgi:ABC-2 type transport system ATP-binding protein
VAGHDVVRERDAVRRNIGLVFQDTTLDTYLTAEQNMRLHAELYGVSASGPAADAPGDGDGRPVGAPRAPGQHLLGRDEAPAGDRARADALAARAVPRRADRRPRPADAQLDLDLHPRAQGAEDITIFLTTHYMDEAEYCDRIAIMDKGVIVVLDTPER